MKNIKAIFLMGLYMAMQCQPAVAAGHKTESLTQNSTVMVKTTFDIEPVQTPVITLAMAKSQLNIEQDFTYDDTLIQAYIDGAVAYAERYMGRSLSQTLTIDADGFEDLSFYAQPKAVLTSVEYLTDIDAGAYTALPAENYKFRVPYGNNLCQLSFSGTLPGLPVNAAAVRIVVTSECPADIKNGLLLKITDMYERREDRVVDEASMASLSFLRPYKTNW